MKDTKYDKVKFGIKAHAIVSEKQLDTKGHVVSMRSERTVKIVRKEADGTFSSGYRKINIAEQKRKELYKEINRVLGCAKI